MHIQYQEILEKHSHILFYDGVCNVCNFSVQQVLRHANKNNIAFCALQSGFAEWLSEQHGVDSKKLNSLLFFSNNKLYKKTSAILKLFPLLNWYCQPLRIFVIVPAAVRDRIYDFIAKNRYRWFGKKDSCMLVVPEQKQMFIDL